MHAEALAATKDWFSEMGKEMQIAEDREAAELFAQTVMDHEKKTGLVCVMLDSVEDESDESDDEDDDDDDDDDDEDADEADDSDAEPSEVSGSGSDDDDGSDEDEEEDPLWAPDGMKERLENALKVYVPPNAAETLDSLQLTLRLTEAVPGGGAVLAEKVVDAAVNAIEANDKNDKTPTRRSTTRSPRPSPWPRRTPNAPGRMTRNAPRR
jgi:cobalamin biosynthesis protein CobT